MAEEVKDEKGVEPTLPAAQTIPTVSFAPTLVRKIPAQVSPAHPAQPSHPAHPAQPAQPAQPTVHHNPNFIKFVEGRPPLVQMEQDVPWKLVFIVYALFAIGALILFGLFLMIMIRMYRQQVFD